MIRNFRFAGVVWLLFTVLEGQAADRITLLGVEVLGNRYVSDIYIQRTSGLVIGKEILPGDFGTAVRKLWDSDAFADVQITLDEETEEGIYIVIEVVENPELEEIEFVGGKKKQKEIKEDLNLYSGMRIPPHLLTEIEQKIKEMYAEDGFLLAEVTAELRDGETEGRKNLLITIDPKDKVKTRDIRFSGNEAFSDRKLRKQLKETKIQKWYLFWRSNFDAKKYDEDKGLLTDFYMNNGYRDFSISSDTVYYSEDERGYVIEINVEEGNQYYFRNFSWTGNTIFSEEQLFSRLNIQPGDLYNQEEFNLAVFDRVQGAYMDDGYIYSQIVPEIAPIGRDSLDITFSITENNQVSVRKIDIAGNTKTRENVIRRELKIMPGDIFNRELLMRSAREIMILNYFADVVPDVVPVDEDEIDLRITVEEKVSDQATASIGFAGEYGITGGGSVEFNNFLGKGQQLAFRFQQGAQNVNSYYYGQGQAARYRQFSFSFVDPMVNDTPVLIGFSTFYYLRGRNSSYYGLPLDREVIGGSIRFGKRLKWPDNYFRSTWVLQGTRKSYRGSEEDLQNYVSGFRETNGLSIGQVISRDSRNHPEFPSVGSVFNWSSTISGGPLQTPLFNVHENFHKHVFRFDWYAPAFWKFVLASSLQFGAIKEIPTKGVERSIIPVDDRFIMGGSGIPYGTMLRGYVDNTVGPYNGRPIGGQVMMKYSAEFRMRFSDNPTVYGLLFAEMGNVWEDFAETDIFDLKRSAGVGIRMFMPMVGMLGFDMGYGFDDVRATSESPEGWRFHVLFGMPF
ncbi:MAG: outer membrane protein assembly factor BamA [Fidelibacterota bacterium]